jgi:hypothetical protein
VRRGADTMRLKAIRAEAEPPSPPPRPSPPRHANIAVKARELEAQHREHERVLSDVMDDRNLWDKLTEGSRRRAVQADEEPSGCSA